MVGIVHHAKEFEELIGEGRSRMTFWDGFLRKSTAFHDLSLLFSTTKDFVQQGEY